MAKLKSAKKKATAMAENSDLSEKQKLKVGDFDAVPTQSEKALMVIRTMCCCCFYLAQAIDRAMRSTKLEKAGKVYVVTKKTGSASSGTAVSSGKVL